ncbi:CapA family protein [Solibacillus daqui]|uniref:CapA family protein n=1 Tax=Solibacillus daqui TaxID=2912187 RepID=UPI00236623B9|nr:CapA family protein [Solibacillus daqui]
MNKLNQFLLGLWIVSLSVLIFIILSMDNGHEIQVVEGHMNNESELVADEKEDSDEIASQPLMIEQEHEPETVPEPEPVPVVTKETIRLAMMGDVLLHYRLAQYKDFTSSFAAVGSLMQSYDYLVANQESLPVGNKYALSGYPQFSSPPHILRDLQQAGVDMVTVANNHTVDKGEGGIRTLFENLDAQQMPYVGAYKNQEDKNTKRIIELGSIEIGMLAYTYGTNGLYLPKGSPFIVNYIDETTMKADIEAIRSEVDVLVVSMHWGSEYAYEENDYQRTYAKMLNEAGVDIVFGTHPHVLQPYKKWISESQHETHVFYSLGNYYSTILTVPNSMIGGIASMEITKEGDVITINNPTLDATSVLLDADGVYRVYPLKDVEARSVKNLEWVKQVVGSEVSVH